MPTQNQRPQVQSQQGTPARTQVAARTHDYMTALPAGNVELEGLVKGLAHFNPILGQMAERQREEQRSDTMVTARANSQTASNPREALAGEAIEVPSTVPPAMDEQYRHSYSQALAHRAAIETRSELQETYAREKDTEGFNLDQFLAQSRARALQGIQNPHAVTIIGEHLTEAEASIRSQFQQDAVRKHEDQRLTTAHRITETFTADMTPEQIAQRHFDWYVPQMRSIQVDPKQSAALLLGRIKTLSGDAGGRPDLFDVFGQKDAEGFTILDRNPQLADHIAQARDHAIQQRDQALKAAKQPALAKVLMDYDDDARLMPERVTQERLTSDVASGALTAEKASSLWHEAQVELGKKKQQAAIIADAEKSMLGYYDPKDQSKVLDQMLGVTARSMWEAAVGGDQRQVKALAEVITQRHSQTGATVPVDTLTRLMETNVSNLQGADGPSQKFLASADIYRAMAADQRYRGLYFKGEADEVMAAFVQHLDGGADAKTAYTAALRVISPEFKELARKRAETPAMQNKIAAGVTRYATGSTMWGWLGGNGRPENQEMLGRWGATEIRRILELNPDLTDKELHDHIERKAAENFVLDTTSQLAVKVPPALSGDLTQKALSAYSQSLADNLKGKGQFPEGTIIRYIPLNSEGLFEVQTWTGSRQKKVGDLTLTDIVNWHRSATTLSQDEGAQLSAVRQALKAGQALPQVDPAILAKGRSVGFFKDAELGQVEKLNREQVLARFKAVPDFGYGKPSNLAAPMPQKPGMSIDPGTTSRLALELAASPVTGQGFEHMGLAGSLIALREGVSLTASKDPNPDAGMNIGAGYNLKANAENVNKDLKRAGVPEDRIEDVKAGRASLTPEQAKRLIINVVPRYEEQTRKTAEATAPGLWTRMTPAQRAVMVDIAYQTGDASQFRKAWGHLAAGDTKAFSDETRVFYKNKAGDRVEDTRARELRASMLAGIAEWDARVQLAAGR